MKTKLEQLKEIKHLNLKTFNIRDMLVNAYYVDLENNLIGYVTDTSEDLETIENEKLYEMYNEYDAKHGYNKTSVEDLISIGHFNFVIFTFENKGIKC